MSVKSARIVERDRWVVAAGLVGLIAVAWVYLVHEAQVVRRTSDFSNPITCHSAEPQHVSQFQLEAYIVEE